MVFLIDASSLGPAPAREPAEWTVTKSSQHASCGVLVDSLRDLSFRSI
jgi:hypothetical protein